MYIQTKLLSFCEYRNFNYIIKITKLHAILLPIFSINRLGLEVYYFLLFFTTNFTNLYTLP